MDFCALINWGALKHTRKYQVYEIASKQLQFRIY
jgi:hypothetical protein